MEHPDAELLSFFDFQHLPLDLQVVSRRFHDLAHATVNETVGPETTMCLRKLLEAKDCAVRATLAAKRIRR